MTPGLIAGVALAAAAAGFGAAWTVQGWRFDAQLERDRREHAQAVERAQAQARATEAEWASNARRAADAYANNAARVRADADRARGELGRLRDALSAASTGAPASAACAAGGADGTANAGVVVGECAAALREVAQAADACEQRLSGLQDWVRATAAPASAARP